MQKSDYRNMWVYIEHDGVTAAPRFGTFVAPQVTGSMR